MDLIGKKLILKLIKDGAAWERAKIYKRSEEKYYKALRIYDSFLISPFSAKAVAQKLSGAMAKLIAISEISDQSFEKAATLFIKFSPDDEHMALLWLKRLFHTKDLDFSAMDHDILTLIAENHHKNQKILPLLTNIFIQLERTDFTAQIVYKNALVYLKEDSEKRIKIQTLVREYKEKEDIPSKLSLVDASSDKSRLIILVKKIFATLLSIIPLTGSALKNSFLFLKNHKKTKIYIKFSSIFLFCILTLFLIFNALSPFFKSKIEKINQNQTQKQITIKAKAPQLPYTIQIAAFLSLPHAQSYTNKLKKTGLDVRFIKVKGKSKTWFLVRISEFKDKSSAAAYGQKLKREGLIKDFFVANK